MRKNLPVAFVLGLVLVGLSACGNLFSDAPIPTGTYISNSGAGNQELKLSGSDYLLVVGGASTVEGSYTSSRNELTLTTSDLSAFCKGTRTNATYKWSLDSNLLTLKLGQDDCSYRAGILEQTWAKR